MLSIFVIGLAFLGCGIFLAHRMSKSDDGQMFGMRDRVIITMAIFALMGASAKTLMGGGAVAGVIGMVIVIPAGVLLAFIWLPSLVETGLSSLTGAMTGGNLEVESKPFFYRALAKRRQGKFSEALAEIDTELLKFPGNLEGLLLKAEIQADDLKNVLAAVELLQEAITTPDRPRSELLAAQFRLAELLLHRIQDIPAGQSVLEQILEENPDSEAAHTARQHLAHLPGAHGQNGPERKKLVVVHHETLLGLTEDLGAHSLPQENWTERAQEWVTHLEAHPNDWEAREKLSTIYADQFQRIPLAIDQIRLLIDQPGQPTKRIVGWLNRIADLELRADTGLGAARSALEEIQSRYPDSPWSEQAALRIAILGRTAKANLPTPTLKIGVYEQNIGLKRGSAEIPNPDPESV
jgi:tetratricopeptide (TPR) repeat protein